MQGALHILTHQGDRTLEWDTETRNKDPRNGPLDPKYVELEFDRLMREGYMAIGSTETETGTEEVLLRRGEFDPQTYPKVTIQRPLAGG